MSIEVTASKSNPRTNAIQLTSGSQTVNARLSWLHQASAAGHGPNPGVDVQVAAAR